MTERPVILVADDDPFMREIARLQLESAGYAVELADGGQSAIDRVLVRRPAAIVLDFAMPGCSGIQVLERLATELAAVPPVLMLTAWSSDSDRRMVEDMGAVWLQKPIMGEALVAAVGSLVEAPDRG